jgi:predicted transcriptional regulator
MVTQKGSEKMRRVGTGKLRQLNDHEILRLLIENQVVTKRELAEHSQLTVATVGTILNDFLQGGIVAETGALHAPKGRPTQRYILNAAYFHTLGH